MLRAVDGSPVLKALESAETRDEIIRLAMRGMYLVARRFATFVVRRDGFSGWRCNAPFGDEEALRAVFIPEDQPSVLATATVTPIYLGPIPRTPAHEALLSVMEGASHEVAAVAARISGRPALILLADGMEDSAAAARFLGELAPAVGEALTRLLTPR
jgi:hypothetical protein